MIKRIFNRELLNKTIIRDNSRVILNDNDKLHSKVYLNFICSCGKEFTKRFDTSVNYGIFCDTCIIKNTKIKKKENRLNNKLTSKINNKSDTFILLIENQEPKVISKDEEIYCTIIPKLLKTILYVSPKNIKVTWWDRIELKITTKNFNKNNDKIISIKEAQEFAKNIPDLKNDYKFKIKISELAKKNSNYIKNLRFFPIINYYDEKEVLIDPYIIGSWLGDGSFHRVGITNVDDEILSYWKKYCVKENVDFNKFKITYYVSGKVSKDGKRSRNYLLDKFKTVGLIGNSKTHIDKHIPDMYKYNSRAIRLQIIAGLIDTDGSLDKNISYEFSQSRDHEKLFDDLKEVVESIGWKMTKNYRIKKCFKPDNTIVECPAIVGFISSGDDSIKEIPLKLNYKKVTKNRQARFDLLKFEIKNI